MKLLSYTFLFLLLMSSAARAEYETYGCFSLEYSANTNVPDKICVFKKTANTFYLSLFRDSNPLDTIEGTLVTNWKPLVAKGRYLWSSATIKSSTSPRYKILIHAMAVIRNGNVKGFKVKSINFHDRALRIKLKKQKERSSIPSRRRSNGCGSMRGRC